MAWIPRLILPKHFFAAIRREKPAIRVSPLLIEVAALAPEAV